MLSAEQRSRLSVVLVGARNPANIGAAARAMHDFGFSDLRFVSEYGVPLDAAKAEAAAKAAVAAGSVLQRARAFQELAAAIADCSLVVGTTAVGERRLAQPLLPLQEASEQIVQALTSVSDRGRVALLFGSEKTGLTVGQLSHCQWLTTIPMFAPEGARHLSMNLGQSVAVCLYELVRSGFEGVKPIVQPAADPTTSADRERLTDLLREVMHTTGYSRRFPANVQESALRRLAASVAGSHAEAEAWMGVCRQVLWSLQTKVQTDDKK